MIYQYLIAAITLCIPALFGIAVISWARILREKISLIAVGTMLGIAVFGTLTYIIGHVIPMNPIVIWLEVLALAVLALLFALKGGTKHFAHVHTDKIALSFLGILLILFSIIGPKLLIERPEGLYTGIINAYGDIGWHAAIITEIAERKILPLENPIFAGHVLTYPFIANLISAGMIIGGSSLAASMNVTAIVLIPILLVLMYIFAKQYALSRTAGIIACLLFLFGGATLGFIRLPKDITQSGETIGQFFLNLPARDYSGVGTDKDGFHFLNPITSLLLPQRAMLFGIPLVLSILILIHPTVIRRRYAPSIAGAMAGMLPLFHAHACIALAFAITAIFLASSQKKRFLFFALPALAIGIPELTFYIGKESEQGSFFRYGPFWMAGDRNHIMYWLQNTGLLIPVSMLALFLKTPRSTKVLVLAGTGIFILADTFLFAPWAWDNFKLFVFWFIFVLPSIGYVTARAIHTSSKIALPIITCSLILLHMVSAGIDIWKLALPSARTWEEWTQEGVVMASHIKHNVPVTSPILTAPVHNSPASIAGRTLFLGYPAHVWSHGALPWNREKEMKEYFEGTRDSIEGLEPRYILIGPQEKSAYPKLVIRPSWQSIAIHGPYTLFRTPVL